MAGPDPAVADVRRSVAAALETGETDASGETVGQPTVLVACSGGADSLALLAGAVHSGHHHRLERPWRVVGVTVDHGLQPDSAERAAAVVAQMAGLGADETASARVEVDAAGLGLEAGARRARYDVLTRLAAHFGAAAVLLGHTRDDQAETVLLGLTRGSGGRSIAGMRRDFTADGARFVRPLLDLPRAATERACAALDITYWTDPHNTDPRFTRARVRHTVLPVLERELGPGVKATLARTGDQLRADMEYLDEKAARAWERLRVGSGLYAAQVADFPTPIRTRVLRLAALEAGALAAELSHVHIEALDALVVDWSGQGPVDLPGHLIARRRAGLIEFSSTRE